MTHQRKTITIDQYETGLDWTPIVRAAGLLSDKHHPFQIYLLAGAIMRDEEVSYRAAQQDAPYERVLRDMTDAERTALRARIVSKLSTR
jgi:hypothetical protein